MAGTAGPNMGLVSGWQAGEDGWDADMNANLQALDAWTHVSVKAAQVAPPVSPAEGDRYIVATGATGAWTGHDGELAAYTGGAWVFQAPGSNWRAWNEAQQVFYRWNADTEAWELGPGRIVVGASDNLQDVIDAAPAGSTLDLGPGVYTAPSTAGFQVSKRLRLRGAGQGIVAGSGGTVLRPLAGTTPEDSVGIEITGTDYVFIENLSVGLAEQPASAGDGHGIFVNNHGEGDPLSGIRIRDVTVFNMGGTGVFYDGEGSYGVNIASVTDVNIMDVRGEGLRAYGCTAFTADRVYAHACGGNGIALVGCQDARIRGCYTEGNKLAVASPDEFKADIYLENCHGLFVTGCNFEEFQGNTNCAHAIVLNNCYAVAIEGNSFMNSTSVASSKSIRILSQTRGVRVGMNAHRRVGLTIDAPADGGNQGLIIEPQFIVEHDATAQANMNVPTFPDYNPVTEQDEGLYSVFYRGQTALAGENVAGYRVVGIQIPILNGIADTADASFEGMISYDGLRKAPIFRDNSIWRYSSALPRLTLAQRDAGTWSAGDQLWITDAASGENHQIYSGSAWRYIANAAVSL